MEKKNRRRTLIDITYKVEVEMFHGVAYVVEECDSFDDAQKKQLELVDTAIQNQNWIKTINGCYINPKRIVSITIVEWNKTNGKKSYN